MKKLSLPFLALLTLLAGLALTAGLDRLPPTRLNLSSSSHTRLKPASLEQLAHLQGDVTITYYVSDRRALPSNLRRMPQEVRDILSEIRSHSHHRVRFQFVDPTSDAALCTQLGFKWMNPFQVKSIQKDEYSVNRIWSGMVIQYQGKERVIPVIIAEHIPSLEAQLMHLLHEMESPQPIAIALSLPWPDVGLRRMIASGAKPIEFNFGEEAIPAEADLVFIVQPHFTTQSARVLRDWLADGKSAFLFASPCRLQYHGPRGAGSDVTVLSNQLNLQTFFEDSGVTIPDEVAMDTEDFQDNPSTLMIPPFGFDMSRFKSKIIGNVIMPVAAPILLNPARLSGAGWTPEPLVHSSMLAWTRRAPARDIAWSDFCRPPSGPWERRSLTLGVMLRHEKPWHGKLFIFSSEFMVDDGAFTVSKANIQYVRNLLMSFTTEEYRPGIHLSAEKPPPVPPLSTGQKLFWRLFCAVLLPLILFLILWDRTLGGRLSRSGTQLIPSSSAVTGGGPIEGELRLTTTVLGPLPVAAGEDGIKREPSFSHLFDALSAALNVRATALWWAGAPLTALLLIALWPNSLSAFWDWTRDRRHELDPSSRQLCSGLSEPVRLRYVTSPASEMSTQGKQMITTVRDRLKVLERYSHGRLRIKEISISRERSRNPSISEGLSAAGIEPFTTEIIEADAYHKRPVYSAIVLEASGRKEVITPLVPGTEAQLEFLIDAALLRLLGRARPFITLIAEQPRLTPAEALEEHAQWSETVPQSPDVYSQARNLFKLYGYQVQTVSPQDAARQALQVPGGSVRVSSSSITDPSKNPDIGDALRQYGFDAKSVSPVEEQAFQSKLLVFFQPFTFNQRLKEELDRHLLSGGNAFVAVQHYDIQQRLYRTRGFEPVYWPQPQFSRIDEWLSAYGVRLQKEVLFDRSLKETTLETQVRYGIKRQIQRQPVALPFLLHATPDHFNKESTLTKRLSDQLFICGNRFLKEPARFPATLTWTNLITTSDHAWAYDWKGGFLPDEVLTNGTPFDEKQSLAIELTGRFPSMLDPRRIAESAGRLVLVGCSEMFRNDHLLDPHFRSNDLLMNAVVEMTYGAPWSRVHSRATLGPQGFGYLSPRTKARFRAETLALFPLLLVAYGFWRLWRSRRESDLLRARR